LFVWHFVCLMQMPQPCSLQERESLFVRHTVCLMQMPQPCTINFTDMSFVECCLYVTLSIS
jgi:hypothetical protein